MQRCCVHKLRNLERKAPKHALAEIRDDFHRIVYAANADVAKARWCGIRSSAAATSFHSLPVAAPATGRRFPVVGVLLRVECCYLLIVTGAELVWFPVVSVATATMVCCPLASTPVAHQSSKVHETAALQMTVLPNCTPSP